MVYIPWSSVPAIKDIISQAPARAKSKYDGFNVTSVDPNVTNAINDEAMQTYYVLTSLNEAKNYGCYVHNTNNFKTDIDSQYATVNAHYANFNSMTYADMIQIEDGTGTWQQSFLGQAATMQKNYEDLIAANPQCSIDCDVYCSDYGARGKKVDVDGSAFAAAIKDYIKDPSSSPCKFK